MKLTKEQRKELEKEHGEFAEIYESRNPNLDIAETLRRVIDIQEHRGSSFSDEEQEQIDEVRYLIEGLICPLEVIRA